jgi:hypothetical protein
MALGSAWKTRMSFTNARATSGDQQPRTPMSRMSAKVILVGRSRAELRSRPQPIA